MAMTDYIYLIRLGTREVTIYMKRVLSDYHNGIIPQK